MNDPKSITGKWVHSWEEDSGNTTVYRPASYEFPPSRTRSGFELNPDGSLTNVAISAVDTPASGAGSWELKDGVLDLNSDDVHQRRSFRVVSAQPDRLVLTRAS